MITKAVPVASFTFTWMMSLSVVPAFSMPLQCRNFTMKFLSFVKKSVSTFSMAAALRFLNDALNSLTTCDFSECWGWSLGR